MEAVRMKTCAFCKEEIAESELKENLYVCPRCGGYFAVPARERTAFLFDEGSFVELFGQAVFTDPLSFPDYRQKYEAACKKSGENEGVLCGTGEIKGHKTCIFVMNPEFMMGSMGTVVGDKITSLFEYATDRKLPVIGFTVSGGARMQEGALSLMQMAKVSAAVRRHGDAGLLYLVGITDPTMGGVTASFAMLGDIIFSEPHARIGFAGKRVVEQVTGEKLPETFQTAEFQLKNGFLDEIVERKDERKHLAKLLSLHGY
ncbi:MAG: acetyl-CoA carboxylase carboxyltransferase subunit beta [Candidatus Borkfalkiaceae bacterium]|nr:acetyl-CoA carboxylase carboxyltransferase subunit beta [Christensenellaceae bacterium]